jgi:high-affinity K+ transport system ATPase subunit B
LQALLALAGEACTPAVKRISNMLILEPDPQKLLERYVDYQPVAVKQWLAKEET